MHKNISRGMISQVLKTS